jgi:hypothetical protein
VEEHLCGVIPAGAFELPLPVARCGHW